MITDSNGRRVVDIKIEHSDDVCDSFIIHAVYADTYEEVPENELDYLTEKYEDYIYEQHLDWNIGRADFYDYD